MGERRAPSLSGGEAAMTCIRSLAVVLFGALVLTVPRVTSADTSGLASGASGLLRVAPEERLDVRIAALGAPSAQVYRRSPPALGRYRPAVGPTRDQTSPFGLEIQAGFAEREVDRSDVRFPFDVESTRLLLKATWRPVRVLELYGLAGIADLDSPFEDADFDGDFGGAIGGGARVTFFRNPEWYDTSLFLDARYLQYESEAAGVLFETTPGGCAAGVPSATCVAADQTFDWREWEARFGVAWRFYLTRPYLGLRYSDAEADSRISISPAEFDLRATDNVGGFAGIDIYFDPDRRVGLNLDVSFPDQVTFTAGLKVWF